MNELYKRIEELCLAKGVKVGRMCKEAGVSSGGITDLKKGRSNTLMPPTLEKIAEYLGVTTDKLLGRDDKKAPAADKRELELSDIEFALFGEVRDLDDEDKAELLRDAKRMRELKELKKLQEGKSGDKI